MQLKINTRRGYYLVDKKMNVEYYIAIMKLENGRSVHLPKIQFLHLILQLDLWQYMEDPVTILLCLRLLHALVWLQGYYQTGTEIRLGKKYR